MLTSAGTHAARTAPTRFARFMHLAFLSALAMTAFARASTITFAIECNNDFALFSGDASRATTLLYQNGTAWDTAGSQSAAANGAAPALSGDYIYLVAMAVGGQSGLWGTFNGVALTSIAGVEVSSLVDLATGPGNPNSSIANASFDVDLHTLQQQLAEPTTTWAVAATTTVGPSQSWTGLSAGSLFYEFGAPGPRDMRVFRFLAANASNFAVIPGGGGAVALVTAAIGFRFRRRWPR